MQQVTNIIGQEINAVTVCISIDQLRLLAHALSLVDYNKLDFPMCDSFMGDSVAEEVESLRDMCTTAAEDPGERGIIHGFCL